MIRTIWTRPQAKHEAITRQIGEQYPLVEAMQAWLDRHLPLSGSLPEGEQHDSPADGRDKACGKLRCMPDAPMTDEEILRWALLTAYPEHGQVILDGRISTDPRHYYPVIFSDGFAKAFWGEENWLYHRNQLLLHRDDPLSYLAEFL
jgi:hypothetical protein